MTFDLRGHLRSLWGHFIIIIIKYTVSILDYNVSNYCLTLKMTFIDLEVIQGYHLNRCRSWRNFFSCSGIVHKGTKLTLKCSWGHIINTAVPQVDLLHVDEPGRDEGHFGQVPDWVRWQVQNLDFIRMSPKTREITQPRVFAFCSSFARNPFAATRGFGATRGPIVIITTTVINSLCGTG